MLVSAVGEQICVMKKLILLCNRGYFLSLYYIYCTCCICYKKYCQFKSQPPGWPKTTLFSRLKTFCQYYQYARCQPHI